MDKISERPGNRYEPPNLSLDDLLYAIVSCCAAKPKYVKAVGHPGYGVSYFIWAESGADYRAIIFRDRLVSIFQGGYNGFPAGVGFNELDSRLDFGQHRPWSKVPLFNVLPGFGNSDALQPFLLRFAKVDGNPGNRCQDNEGIGIDYFSQLGGCFIFINNCVDTG